MADHGMLPFDGMRLVHGEWKRFPWTTPTDIAAYIWSVLAADRLKIISSAETERRLGTILASVGRIKRVHGFFVDRLNPTNGEVLITTPTDNKPIVRIASSVDNGWLAASLILVRNTIPSLRAEAEALLQPMDFGFFHVPFDPRDPTRAPGQMHGPYYIDTHTFGGFEALLNTEQRIATYIGITQGTIPPLDYFRIGRTLKSSDTNQSRRPEGVIRTYHGVPVFEGHYTYRGMRVVPSWGGSMFEALMVTLFVPEEVWSPKSWGINHPLYVRCQIEYGLKQAEYGFWGFSPACNPEGGYQTYGIEALGSDPTGYSSGNDVVPSKPASSLAVVKSTNGVVTPHASFLALRFAPTEAIQNLRKLKATFSIYGEYGFFDSVNVSKGIVADRVLILDQGMIMASIANALANDAMRHAFVDSRMEETLRPMMAIEEFTAGTLFDSESSGSKSAR